MLGEKIKIACFVALDHIYKQKKAIIKKEVSNSSRRKILLFKKNKQINRKYKRNRRKL